MVNGVLEYWSIGFSVPSLHHSNTPLPGCIDAMSPGVLEYSRSPTVDLLRSNLSWLKTARFPFTFIGKRMTDEENSRARTA